ncbi:efflux RND transporter permease subunit [Geobacter argillaceus]|uniref:Cobalt-zinc-cadmium resistance protein CzcA n=1 Tax=Geobacter argillaceus TaxID=345631 RepID=A0A562VLR1_9BACT|nr:CusA/CzcA family heavy metal efflux RND transporter [Geobacter argillaceus]TWJ18830.1 cobalt-zinc-cadmium resistance protein CzcA [Geobacter argillaceus]
MRQWIIFVTNHSLLFLLLIGSLVLVGAFFVKDLNVEAFPDPSPPIVEITTVYEGRSAEEVERQITVALEVALAGMDGIERLNSISLYGLSDVKCKFSYHKNYKEAKQEVINRLAGATLPAGVQPTIVANPIGEVMRYTLTGSDNLLELRGLQDWTVARHLKTADGVEDVPSEGGFIKMYNVVVQPENLIKYGITLAQVIDSLSKANLNVGGRAIEKGDQYYMVRGLGLIKSLADIENALVTVKSGKPVLVRNVAQVSIGNIPRTGIVALNDRDDIVMGTVVLRRDAKSIPSIRSLHEKIDELNTRILPKGIRVVPYYERWDLIVTVIKKVMETAASGIVLVAVALFLFLGNIRAAVITAAIIPVSLLITLAVMALKGESANLLSIGAIDFGIIADIPLLLIEDYFRLSRKHGSGAMTIVRTAEEIGKPMIFSVGIILLAFIPIFMMKGAEAQIFAPMAKTYLYAILFTLTLTFSYLVAAKHRLLKGACDREFGFLEKLKRNYLNIVWFLLGHRRKVLTATFAVVTIGLVVGLKIISSQFLPKMDEGNIYARIVFPYTISLTKTYEHAREAKKLFLGFPEVQTVDFKIGRPEDGTDPNGPFNSDYTVLLKPYDQWKRGLTKEELEDEVREKLAQQFPNADINLSQYIQDNLEEMMSGVKGENSVKIFGDDLVQLDRIAKEVKEALTKVSGIADEGIMKELGQPNLIIDVHRETASALGLTVQDVLDTVAAALGGKEISQIIEGSRNFSLQVSFPPEYRKEPEKIPNIPIVLPGGGVVALSRIADVHYDTGASFIYRENYRKYIPIKFSVTSNDLGGTVAKAQELTRKIKLPDGYYMEWSGMFNEMKKSFQRFMISIPVALFLILTALYLLYRSVRNVLITMAAPLFAVFAGLLGLLIMGESLSVSSMVGFISIIGVSILNSSVIISHYIRLSLTGLGREEAIMETVKDKFRPVLMGGSVAALGLLPASMAHGIGSQVQRPLAIVVVGGMLLGTTLILLITPLLLKFVQVEE